MRNNQTILDLLRHAMKRFEEAELAHGHGASDPLDEAVFLILEGLKLPVQDINPYLKRKVTAEERDHILHLIDARVTTRKPSAYLLNRIYMQGVSFYIDERAIIPRSFIGELMANGIFESGILDTDSSKTKSVLDLCTGSGCLAILAAKHFPEADVAASDLSADALEVARINLKQHDLEKRIALYQGDLFAPLDQRKFDLIIANPPYVAKAETDSFPDEYRHEPLLAHLGGEDGLDLVRQIIRAAPKHLNPGGGLICEVGTQGELLNAEFPDLNFFWLDTEESVGEVFFLTF